MVLGQAEKLSSDEVRVGMPTPRPYHSAAHQLAGGQGAGRTAQKGTSNILAL